MCLPPSRVLRTFREAGTAVHLATEDGSMGVKGMITDVLESFLARMEKKTDLVLYACGPHAMLGAVNRIAGEHSLSCYVSLEARMACGVGACMGCSVPVKAGGYKRVCKEGPVFRSDEIDWSDTLRVAMRK